MLTLQNILNRIDVNSLTPETPIAVNVNGTICEFVDIVVDNDERRVLTFYVYLDNPKPWGYGG